MTKQERYEYLNNKLTEMQYFDESHNFGKGYIAGVDEVGRGPLAGPVVAAAVVLPRDFDVVGIDDSKKLTEKKREKLFEEIIDNSIAYGIGRIEPEVIDEINILEATKRAMNMAVREANRKIKEFTGEEISKVLVDGLETGAIELTHESIVKGDSKSLSIAAASIIAKVIRDREMIEYSRIYPYYSFEKNKGYGTKAHYEGIKNYGITKIHRKSFLKNISNI